MTANSKPAVILIITFFVLFHMASANSPYQFLRLASSARAAALSGCFVSVPNDASAVYYNPASISTVDEKRFSTSFLKHVLDINSGLVSYMKEYEDVGIIAASIAYTSYGSFDYADKDGNKGGTFGANNMSIAATYSNELDTNLYYGVTLKFIYAGLENYSSTAMAVDAGIFYELADGRTTFGASVLNSGMQLSTLNGVDEKLPLDVRIGASHRLRGLPLLANISFHHLADDAGGFFEKFRNFSLGGELYIGKFVRLRLGYDNQIRTYTSVTSSKGMSGLSGGFGLFLKDINIDYGVAQYGSAATLHRFSINYEI